MDNYVKYHLHSSLSNPTCGNKADSTTNYQAFVDRAAEVGMTAMAFSEHGNTFRWKRKKDAIEKSNMKYIHANEVYVTEHNDKDLKLIRDNYHYMLIAKNWDGVKELNSLGSDTFSKEDGHFYFNPRITFEELYKTSDNILMTSACLASPLWRLYKKSNLDIGSNESLNAKRKLDNMLYWMEKNKHRMFFEIQYHNHPEQIAYNKMLLNLSKELKIPLIAGTDTHEINQDHMDARKLFLQSKGATYGDEDSFDLTFKTYPELVGMFEKQNALPRNEYLEAIHNTNVMADMVEEFKIDYTPKYPKMSDNPDEEFKEKIRIGVKERNINKKPKEEIQDYFKRIRDEFDTYKELNAIDYMLLKKNIIDWCHKNDIFQGYGRGSVTGSIIAYLLNITELDSIKYNLNFTRFLNKDRVTLADIDVDLPPSRRQEVIDYVASLDGIQFAEIITFNTMALRKSIEVIGKGLKFNDSKVDKLKELADSDYEKFKKDYPKVERYLTLLKGTIESIGSHASGFLVSPIDLAENVGLCKTKESKYDVTCLDMKELEGMNYVKLDLLGLDNIESVNETCKLANIDRLTPDNMDFDDFDVWKSIRESTLGVFQWESNSAFNYYKRLFSDETIKTIKEISPNTSYIDLLSIGNGAIRPSGDSYRDDLAAGNFHDNGHEALNEFLSPTMGQLVYQEQIIEFLTRFCGFTMGQADLVRRGLAKKVGTHEYIPKIKQGFIDTMMSKYKTSKEKSEDLIEYFLKVIDDASDYGFSTNHSYPYSMLGYANAWLRHYYPLEYLTALMNVKRNDKEDIAKIIQYANLKGFKLKPIEFGKSIALYNLDKEEKNIYKGIKSVAYMNDKISDELYELSKNKYRTFTELLVEISDNTSVDTRQLDKLIRLNFFKGFGKVERLLAIYDNFINGEYKYKKTYVQKTKDKRIPELIRWEQETSDTISFPINDKLFFELENLGYIETTLDVPKSYCVVLEVNAKFKNAFVYLYQLSTGNELKVKIKQKDFFTSQGELVQVGDYIEIVNSYKDYKWFKNKDPQEGEKAFYQDGKTKELIVDQVRHIK
ncbi:PHP domain-containing protein [Aquibacillus saliphilus]|uniref:PHP domain-containing protein n=1 Tax=Aquibacillus saliphilus TaxID=1909422 RepID=UPI001CEFC3A2|nr:PHP domain-containing protein [Aquibacillus saliphilus]